MSKSIEMAKTSDALAPVRTRLNTLKARRVEIEKSLIEIDSEIDAVVHSLKKIITEAVGDFDTGPSERDSFDQRENDDGFNLQYVPPVQHTQIRID